jgi:thiamine biosynthesis lipoprotein
MIRRAQPWLGTLVDITADNQAPGALSEAQLHQAVALAFAEVALVHKLMSFHDPDSDLARLNRAPAAARLSVHAHTWHVLQLAQAVAAASDGVFNIACAPRLVDWQCLPAPPGPAPRYEPGVVVLRCEADGAVRKLAPGWVDLGGIAKGYAVDLALAALARSGVARACVNAGGDLRVSGVAPFPIDIRAPRDPRRSATRILLCNEAMASSATYFSAKDWDGGQVSALVDGRDGQPLVNAGSVSVRAPLCALADALTKVVLATGDAGHPALREFDARALII